MGVDVVGVAVPAVGVVSHHDVWAQLTDERDECADGLALVGVDETLLAARRRAGHAGVTPASRAAQEDRFVDAQGSQGCGELADAVTAELVGVVDGQLRPALADDLTLLAERAGDDVHLRARAA